MNNEYRRIVISGLQRLITLRLRGHPPMETITAVAEVWLDALHSCGDWDDQRHLNGLIEAFKQAEATLDHFPAPAEIRRLKPTVVDTAPKLPPPPQDRGKINQVLADIFNGIKMQREGKMTKKQEIQFVTIDEYARVCVHFSEPASHYYRWVSKGMQELATLTSLYPNEDYHKNLGWHRHKWTLDDFMTKDINIAEISEVRELINKI